jgi:hypothetical protein
MPRDRHAEHAAHRAAERLPAERIGAARGADDAGRAAGFGSANDRPDIARVLHVREQQHQLRRPIERVFERDFPATRDSDDAGRVAHWADRFQDGLGDRNEARAGPLRLLREDAERAAGSRVPDCHHIDFQVRRQCLFEQMRAVEEHELGRWIEQRTKAPDDRILPARDALHPVDLMSSPTVAAGGLVRGAEVLPFVQ